MILALLPAPPAQAAQITTATEGETADRAVTVVLADDGPQPVRTVVDPGASVTWRNDGTVVQHVTGASGALDSGDIPVGGAFTAAIDEPGLYPYDSVGGSGWLVVGDEDTTRLVGPPDALADDAVPDRPFEPRPAGDMAEHPDLLVDSSQTRALVGFADDTTIAEANAALDAAGVVVAGGIPAFDQLLVVLEQPPAAGDFAPLDAALVSLRANPAVHYAARDFAHETDTLPTPAGTGFVDRFQWTWEPVDGATEVGQGYNWHLEASRWPAAWNLREAIERTDPRVQTVVADKGFADHPDLDLEHEVICHLGYGTRCTEDYSGWNDPDAPEFGRVADHGLHVAGIIGADHARDNVDGAGGGGVAGANPVADLIGISAINTSRTPQELHFHEIVDALLVAKQNGTRSDVRVVNYSAGLGTPGEVAWQAKAYEMGPVCGPGPDDDGEEGGTVDANGQPGQWCRPDIEDDWLKEVREAGKSTMPVAERASRDGLTIVTSAGNDGDTYCSVEPPLVSGEPCSQIPSSAATNSGLGWVTEHWDADPSRAGLADPILTVGGIGSYVDDGDHGKDPVPSLERAPFSNVDAIVSAPGWALSPIEPHADRDFAYAVIPGTSQAAPQVAALAGYLLAYDPNLSVGEVRDTILTWARDDTAPDAAPRIDAFASMLSLDGAARHLVDVNDPSADGNRRLIQEPDGTTTLDTVMSDRPEDFTAPDSTIDMRDFRRFRDAWLQRCETDPETGCPATISLDGHVEHPKRDLNFDGCVYVPASDAGCSTPETIHPRFDFNGDGQLSVVEAADVPLTASGAPAADPGAATSMTDLDVLASQWDAGTAGAEDREADELGTLLRSGDLHVDVSALVDASADDVTVVASDTSGAEPQEIARRTFAADTGTGVITLPAATPVELHTTIRRDTGTTEFATGPWELVAGEDRHLTLCGGLTVAPDQPSVRPEGSAEVNAALDTCDGAVDGHDVTFTMTPSGAGHATLAASTATTGPAGLATVGFTAGTEETSYTITARADVTDVDGNTVEVSAETIVDVSAVYDYERVASAGGTSGYEGLGDGPSIVADGTVAFAAQVAGVIDIFTSGAGADPASPATATNVTGGGLPAGAVPETYVQLGDNGHLVTRSDNLADISNGDGTGDWQAWRSWIHRWDTATPGTGQLVASGAPWLSAPTGDATFKHVGVPAVNGNGEVVVSTEAFDDDQATLHRWTPSGGLEAGGVSYPIFHEDESEAVGRLWPQYADDGTMAVRRTIDHDSSSTGVMLEGLVCAGDAPLTVPFCVAGGSDGWTTLGARPGLADDGAVLAFAGDRGDGEGIFLSHPTTGGNWSDPVRLVGENETTPRAELGTTSAGDPIHVSDIPADERVGIIHQPMGPDGLVGDSIVVTFRGSPSAAGPGFGAQDALWSMRVHVAAGADGGDYDVTVDTPVPVVQVGTVIDGEPVESVSVHDPIAIAEGLDRPAQAGDHRIVYFARTATRQHIVRAIWIGEDTEPATVQAAASAVSPRPVFATASEGTLADIGEVVLAAASDDEPTLTPQAHTDGPSAQVVPSFVVSDAAAETGDTVTITNRSRTLDGTPVGVILAAGDGGSDRWLDADSSRSVTYVEDGTPTVSVTATDDDGTSLSAGGTLEVAPPPNEAPVADAGGPYTTGLTYSVTLDATASTDPNGDDTIASYGWDLDDDGTFDDVTDATVTLPWTRIESDICGGTCVEDTTYPLAVRVVDDEGVEGVATSSLTVVGDQDFRLVVEPSAPQLVDPGNTAPFQVRVDAINGFAEPVDLTVEGLPEGWTSRFLPSTVTPSGTSMLEVHAPDDAVEGTVDIVVVGSGGGITHRATGTAEVVFGLVPECDPITVSGTVTDAETGAPLEGAEVGYILSSYSPITFTAADGTFSFETVPDRYYTMTRSVQSITSGYWLGYQPVELVCGVDVTGVDIELEPVLTGAIEGRVVEGRTYGGGTLPSDTPLAGVEVRYDAWDGGWVETTTAADGTFRFDDVSLGSGNTSVRLRYRASGDATYWASGTHYVVVEPEQVTDVGDIPLVEKCTGFVGGGTVVDENGDPVVDATVSYSYSNSTQTDETGAFSFGDEVLLAPQNRTRVLTFTAVAPASWEAAPRDEVDVELDSCGGTTPDVELQLDRPAPERYGSIDGVVTDLDTGETLEGIRVTLHNYSPRIDRSTYTDADGYYVFEDVDLGRHDNPDVSFTPRLATDVTDVYYRFSDYRLLQAGTTTTHDIQVEPKRFGAIAGVVRDIATQEPVEDARVSFSTFNQNLSTHTAADGSYRLDDVLLEQGSTETTIWVDAEKWSPEEGRSYFEKRQPVTVRRDETTTGVDFDLLPPCPTATIRGLVVDATDLEPIEGAEVVLGYASSGEITGADGRFEFSDIGLDEGNQSRRLRVTASAEGYYSATKYVEIHCGSTVYVEFGTPSQASGTIVGTVTDAGGAPLAGVQVTSEFGVMDETDAQGDYRLEDAPLALDGGDRTWTVAAIKDQGLTRLATDVTVTAGTEVRQDFAFGVNASPVATDVDVITNVDEALDVTLEGADPDGDPITFEVDRQPEHGTLSGTAPDLTYTPDPGYRGQDTFTFLVSDGTFTSSLGWVRIKVNGVPEAIDRDETLDEGEREWVYLRADDPDGDELTYEVLTQPSHGTLTGEWPDHYYQPDEGFHGEDSFTFRVSDGHATSEPATVRLLVNGIPQAQDLELTTPVDTDVFVQLAGTDPEGDDLTFRVRSLPDNGDLDQESDSAVTYDPDYGFAGEDTFTYNVSDGEVWSELATVTITVVDQNQAPTADDVSASAAAGEAVDIGLSATDPDGDPLTFAVADQPANGAVVLNGDTATYTSDAGFSGQDTFTYVASDGELDSVPATVTVSVNGPPEMTITGPERVAVGETVTLDVSATDPDGDDVRFRVGGGSAGNVSIDDHGDDTATVTFAPTSPDGWVYIVLSATDDVNPWVFEYHWFQVIDANARPQAEDLDLTTTAGGAVTIPVAASDADGDGLTYWLQDPPDHGTLQSSTRSPWTYTPDAGFTGTDSFTYTASDGQQSSAPATVTITVVEGNEAPQLEPLADRQVDAGTSVEVAVAAHDPDGDPVSLTAAGLPSFASFADHGDGTATLSLAPDPDAAASLHEVEVTVSDGQASTSSVMTVEVVPNAPPLIDPIDDQQVRADETVTVELSATDPDGDGLRYGGDLPTFVDLVDHGNGTATVGIAPDGDDIGSYTVEVEVTDGVATVYTTFSIEVTEASVCAAMAPSDDDDVHALITQVRDDLDTLASEDGPAATDEMRRAAGTAADHLDKALRDRHWDGPAQVADHQVSLEVRKAGTELAGALGDASPGTLRDELAGITQDLVDATATLAGHAAAAALDGAVSDKELDDRHRVAEELAKHLHHLARDLAQAVGRAPDADGALELAGLTDRTADVLLCFAGALTETVTDRAAAGSADKDATHMVSKVLHELDRAVKDLAGADGGAHAPAADALEATVDDLLDGLTSLAEGAVAAAADAGDDDRKLAEDAEKAADRLESADASRDDGEAGQAAHRYEQACRMALDALAKHR